MTPPRITLFTYAEPDTFAMSVMHMVEEGLNAAGWPHERARRERLFAGRDKRLTQSLAQKIVEDAPDVVISMMTNGTHALLDAIGERSTPIVSWSMDLDAALMIHPAAPGRLTGVSFPADYQHTQLSFLKEIKPGLKKVGHLHNPSYSIAEPALARMMEAGKRLSVQVAPYHCDAISEINKVIRQMGEDGVQAITVGPHEMFNANGAIISDMAVQLGLPAVGLESIATNKGVAGFAPDFGAIWRAGGAMAGRILNGENPSGIEINRSIPPRIILNLDNIKRLGLCVPSAWLDRAEVLSDAI